MADFKKSEIKKNLKIKIIKKNYNKMHPANKFKLTT